MIEDLQILFVEAETEHPMLAEGFYEIEAVWELSKIDSIEHIQTGRCMGATRRKFEKKTKS